MIELKPVTEFEHGVSAACHDWLALGAEVVRAAADESAETPQGLNAKFSRGYRRFAYHDMKGL